jgi:hypothetical protein
MSAADRIRLILQSLATAIAVVPLVLAIIQLSRSPEDRGITFVVVVASAGIFASAVILYRYWELAQKHAEEQPPAPVDRTHHG